MTAIRTDDGNSRDHWIPQFYLRRWITGPEKKLSAFWRENDRERHSHCSPRAVLSENHLDAEFFTSDAPLCSRPSIDAEDAIHVFPLSPKRCMVASHDPANVAKLCGAPLPIFVSVINLGTLTRANTAIARDRRYEREIFKFLGASVNRTRSIYSSL